MKKLFILLLTTMIIWGNASAQSILYEGFESASIPPTGWIATSDCESYNWYGWILSSFAHTGNYSAFIDYAPEDQPYHNSYLITPQLAISGHKMLSFWHAASDPGYSDLTIFTIEISTTGTNPEDFTVVEELPEPATYGFNNKIIDLSSYNGQNIYIAFHIIDEYGTGVYIDDIDVYELSNCLPPTNLTATNIDFNQVTLTWDTTSLANSYIVECIPASGNWTNAISQSTTNNSITINNLLPAIDYLARVKSDCGETTTSDWSAPISFSTLCEAITLTQENIWTENFENISGNGTVALSSCWATPLKSPSYNSPHVYCGLASASHSGLNSLEMRGNNNETNIVVLPAFTNDLNTLKMSFFANTTAPVAQSAGTVQIGYITDPDDPTTFVALETVTPKPESFSRQSSAPYGPFYFVEAGTEGRIAIRFQPNSYSTSWNFDDFSVVLLAECTEPIHLQALNVSDVSVDLTWAHKEGYVYDVLCWQSGTQDTTYYYNVSIENGIFHIDSLTPSTSYSWIVRTVCTDSTYSYAVTPGHFNTPHATLTLPYLCDFEDTSHDYTEEFSFSGSGVAQWRIGSATSAPSTDGTSSYRSLYISEDQGTSNAYSTQNYSYSYAVFDVYFPNEPMEYHLEFDLKVVGECSWDEFSVHMLDGGASIPNSGTPGGVTLIPPRCDLPQWTHHNVIVPDATGQAKRIVFYWHNDNYVFGNPPAAIDNIVINGNACARPSHLEVDNLSENEVTLTWQENAFANSWTLHFKDANSDTYQLIEVYDSTTIVLQNLIPNTEYVCYVTADCDNGETSNPSNPITFRTPCSLNGISNFPYIENFDSYESIDGSDYVPCWSRLNSSTAHYAYVNHMDFESSCLDFHYTPNCYTMAILPMFNPSVSLSELQLTMDVRRHNLTMGSLEVGAMTDPSDASTFQVIDTVRLSSTYEWINRTIYCEDYTGDGHYLAFRVNNAGYYTVAIDNLVVDYLPNCVPPSHILVSDITDTTSHVSWNGVASFFRVYLLTSTDTLSYDVTDNYITLNNLTPSSTYSIMVQSYCDDDTSAISDRVSFNTQCGPITISTENPWFESFENYNEMNEAVALSPCWATPNISINSDITYPTVFNHAGITHSGKFSLEIKGPTNMFVLPEFTNDLSTLQISLWGNTIASNASQAGTLLLGVITDVTNPSTFSTVSNIPATAFNRVGEDAPYTNYIGPFDFSSVNWQPGMRIAFRYQNAQANNSWNLDDILVSLIPECASPEKHSLTFNNVTESTATVHWQDENSSHDTWVVFYKPVESSENDWQSDTAFYDQSLTISGLTSNTTYEVYVISYCGTDITHPDATLTKQFTTTQVPVNIPFSTDFSQSNIDWKLNNGDCENYWIVRNTTPTGNNHALFITNNGVTPGYNVTSTSIVTAEKLFTVGQSAQVLIEFDVNVGGEAVENWDYDYMKMFFAPSSAVYEASSTDVPEWANSTNSVYAFNFSEYLAQTGSNAGTPYTFSLTQGNIIHISAIMDNPNQNPNASSTAKLVFAWINDYIDGTQPGAIITNLSISAVSCPQPSHLIISNIEATEADIYWIAGQDETIWNVGYKESNATNWTNITTTNNSYHLTNLVPNMHYDVRIQANCGSSSSPFVTTTFITSNCGQASQCNYSFLMSDSYGDGWNGGYVSVMQNGAVVENVTLTGSYDGLVTLPLCDNTPTSLVWHSGQYDYECGFIFAGPDGSTLFSISSLGSISNPTLFSFTTDCSAATVCDSPNNLTANDITLNSANVSWDESANNYVLQYKKSTESTWSPDIYLITNSYSFTNLEQNTAYNIRVKGECSENNWSDWSSILIFTTLSDSTITIEPTVITNPASDITSNSAQLNGTITDSGNQTIIARGFEWKVSGSGIYTSVNSTYQGTVFSTTLTGLTANTNYTYRAFVTTANSTSYGDEVTFTTTEDFTCYAPTGLDTVAVSNQFITIHWTDNADASQWNVQYCIPNSSWITENAYATTHTISGLAENTTYQIRVRANCEAGQQSDWSDILEVVTKHVGIDEHLLNSIKLYPNPANDVINVQCTMNNVQVEAIEVFDVYGKVVRTGVETFHETSLQTAQINVSGLAAGMYFVRVTTEQGAVTKSFVKK